MPLILVGRYLPIKLLGQGGFGAAFLARDRYTPGFRQCVVKQFQPSGNLSPTQLQTAQNLFEREAEVLEKLGNEHPQIPDLFAFFELSIPNPVRGKDDKFFYLVQEFIDGQTLEEELLQKGTFSEADISEVLRETLKILQFVHENGSIHRDIKPSNIMRHRNGRLYLLDFGAVKYATKSAVGSNGSTGIYSLGFAPPEQTSGGEVYPSSDLYALAVTCLLLLTGKQSNELFDAYSNSWKWKNDAQVTSHLAAVLDRMLRAIPSERFQSAAEVLSALTVPQSIPTNIQAAPSTPVASPSSSPPPAPPTRPKSRLPAFSTLEILGGALFTGFEGGLIAIALISLLGTTWISGGFWIILLGILVLAQSLRVIEKIDLVILAVITLAVIVFVPQLNRGLLFLGIENVFLNIIFLAGFAGLLGLAISILFRLIFKLVSRIL